MPIYPATGAQAFTWANKPTASSMPGRTIRISDLGVNGSVWVSDGTNWTPAGPIQIGGSTVPIGNAPTGTMGNNGSLTLGTALQYTYSSGLYLYFPANAIVAGSAVGFYWTVMSTTTAGTVYNNVYTPGAGMAAVPASNTAFSTTGPGAYTGVTSEITTVSFTVPGNAMGKNGSIATQLASTVNNNANSKSIRQKFGGTQVFAHSETSIINLHFPRVNIANRGVANAQICTSTVASSTTSASLIQSSIDTTADATLTMTYQLTNAADTLVMEACLIELVPRY